MRRVGTRKPGSSKPLTDERRAMVRRLAREEPGITQDEIAVRVGVSQATVSRILNEGASQ